MRQVKLGKSGPEISCIAFGCMSLEQGDAARQRQGIAAVHRAFELGITLYDTADVYGRGASEELLGRALKEGGIGREQVVIASKCGILFPGMEPSYEHKAYDASAAYVRRSCEASLRRLGTEYIDLYQIHRIDYLTHPQETAAVAEELKREGKIRHFGVSNHTPEEIRALAAHAELASLQTQFSLLHLEPLETGLMATCLELGLAVLAWSPLHRGVLAGVRPGRRDDWQVQREQGVVAQVAAFAARYGVTVAQLALAWLMHLPAGVIPLVGTASADHIAEAAGAADLRLERDDWYELLVTGRGRPMPWGQRPYLYLRER